jgi:predicted TIM-barrel fold metal-dependent hydrolase
MMSAVACMATASFAVPTDAAASQRRGGMFSPPPGACDCHVHVIGPQALYPMVPERAYTPPEANVTNLRVHLSQLRVSRVVLIQPSFYGTDNQCMVSALQELGSIARGIAVVDDTIPDEELAVLAANGVRGVRVNLESSGVRDPAAARRALSALATRIAPLGWHIQIYASSRVIAAAADDIAQLDVPVVLDHFGMLQTKNGSDQPDMGPISELVRSGRAYVKLSAPYRISHAAPHYSDVQPFARAFIEANPERVLWASDWPHTDRAPGKGPTEVSPFRVVDDRAVFGLLEGWADNREVLQKILVSNPAALYGF